MKGKFFVGHTKPARLAGKTRKELVLEGRRGARMPVFVLGATLLLLLWAAPGLVLGAVLAVAVAQLFFSKSRPGEAQPIQLRPPRDVLPAPLDPAALKHQVARGCLSENPMVRSHSCQLARQLLTLEKVPCSQLSPEELSKALSL